jgi:hypothetical protein
MLLELAYVVDGGCANEMVAVILDALVNRAGLTKKRHLGEIHFHGK